MRVAKRRSSEGTCTSKARSLLATLMLAIVAVPAAAPAQSKAPTNLSAVANGSSTPAAENSSHSDAAVEIIGLKKQMAEQQKQIDELRLLIEEQRKLLAGRGRIAGSGSGPEPAKSQPENVLGYFESDFLGTVPGNVAVSSNSDPNCLRLYWVDVRKGKLKLMGGQSWSMLTPNRKGLSPLPPDVFYTQDIDVNYQAGLV